MLLSWVVRQFACVLFTQVGQDGPISGACRMSSGAGIGGGTDAQGFTGLQPFDGGAWIRRGGVVVRYICHIRFSEQNPMCPIFGTPKPIRKVFSQMYPPSLHVAIKFWGKTEFPDFSNIGLD